MTRNLGDFRSQQSAVDRHIGLTLLHSIKFNATLTAKTTDLESLVDLEEYNQAY